MSKLNQSSITNIPAHELAQQNHKTKMHCVCVIAISVIVAAIWIISPIDPIPDLLTGLGQVDDILVACTAIVTSLLALKQRFSAVRNNEII